MSGENEGSENKQNVAEKKKKKAEKSLPAEIRNGKDACLSVVLLLFAGAMWLIFAPSAARINSRPTDLIPDFPPKI